MPAGIALQTKSDDQEIAVLVWGYAKNLPYHGHISITAGKPLVLSGSGYLSTSGSQYETFYHVGKCVTGSATGGTIVAFIDCMT